MPAGPARPFGGSLQLRLASCLNSITSATVPNGGTLACRQDALSRLRLGPDRLPCARDWGWGSDGFSADRCRGDPMLKWVAPWVVLAAVLGFALGASLLSQPSDCFQHGPATVERGGSAGLPAPKEEHDCKPWWGPEWSLVWATIGLVIVTFGLAWFTAYLFWTTRALADDSRAAIGLARDEFNASHRPILRVRRMFVWPMRQGHEIVVQFEVANVGSTEATLKRCEARVEVLRATPGTWLDGTPEPQWHGSAASDDEIVIESGGTHEVILTTDLAFQNRARFSAGNMLVRGHVLYGDRRNVNRRTGFERVWRAEANRRLGFRFTKRKEPDSDYEYED